ncbi:hypothetical protein SUGI_1201290 [Cryptomeria japonica]|nr:hypothetical protein SUGI_1201290 [Cryptomeria japonica]
MNSYVRTKFQAVSRKAMDWTRNKNTFRLAVGPELLNEKVLGCPSKRVYNVAAALTYPEFENVIQEGIWSNYKLSYEKTPAMMEECHQNGGTMEREQTGANTADSTFQSPIEVCAPCGVTREGKEPLKFLPCTVHQQNMFLGGSLNACDAKIDEHVEGAFEEIFTGRETGHCTKCLGKNVGGLCESGKTIIALRLFRSMKQKGCATNVYTYTALVHGFSKEGRWEEAYSLLHEMGSKAVIPNVVTLDIIVEGLCKQGKVEEACTVLDMMVENNFSANLITYNIMLHALCSARKFQKACQLMDLVCEKGLLPDLYTYTTIIECLCKAGQVIEAHRLLQHLFAKGCVLDIVTCNVLLNGLCQKGRLDEAYAFLRDVECKGFCPNLVTHNTLLNGLCKTQKFQQAFHLFVQLPAKGCSPDIVSYNIMISSLCKEGKSLTTVKQLLCQMSTSDTILRDMCCKGWTPDVLTYGALIRGYCKEETCDWKPLYGFVLHYQFPKFITKGIMARNFNDVQRKG